MRRFSLGRLNPEFVSESADGPPATFRKWRDATPDGFVFAIKAPRFIVQRKDLASAGKAVESFIASGITELGPKLGPILWQLSPTKRFHAAELEAFFALLPASAGRITLRHALEVRNPTFMSTDLLSLARDHGIALVTVDDTSYPACADVTGAFVYARLRRCSASIKTGYSLVALKRWASRAELWARGREPRDLPRIDSNFGASAAPRDVFVYFINGAKERAPAAARKLLSLVEGSS